MCAHKLAQTLCILYDEHMQFPSLLYFKTALYGWNYKTVHALLKWEKKWSNTCSAEYRMKNKYISCFYEK